MRVLLDSCVWGGAWQALADAGHQVTWVGQWLEGDPGDEAILDHAARARAVLVTLDKDFGELAIVHGRAHAGIVRLVGIAARAQGPTLVEILPAHAATLDAGGILTVYRDRVRVRRPDPA
ncbi:DUF5615 family PIN-like protein [Myxococcota bacterium]|nr:DUF5615 family PIN-like protein [Myxococcota bacterium]